MYQLAVVLLSLAWCSALTPCTQKSWRDFRADDKDCRIFHICSFGRLATLRCSQGGVFDPHSLSCVPAHSFMDRCSSRLTTAHHNHPCPAGFTGRVAHPTRCAQYYLCGQPRPVGISSGHRGWEEGQRECPSPFVFSAKDAKCVALQPGVCGQRMEPLDPCEYQANQCEGHAECIPCHVRFPSCRGRKDGLNAWAGRQGSPYYVTCHQQRVLSTGMCSQQGAVAIFDENTLKCVMKEEEKKEDSKLPSILSAFQQNGLQRIPQRIPQHGSLPHPVTPHIPTFLGNQLLTNSPQQQMPHFIPQLHVPNQNQNQNGLIPNQYRPIQNEYSRQHQHQQQHQQQ